MNLYHYTCRHSMARIGTGRGVLLPAWQLYDEQERANASIQVQSVASYVWLTDLDTPIADAIGLSNKIIRCDRTEHRYRMVGVSPSVTRYVSMRRTLSAEVRAGLEAAPGAMPMHWWVSDGPVPVVFDPVTVTA